MNFVFFSPYTLMWNTTLVEKSLKVNLEDEENKLFVVNCNTDLVDHCMNFNASGLGVDVSKDKKLEICNRCNSYKNLLRKNLDKNFFDLQDLITKDDIILINNLVKEINIKNFESFQYLDIPVGKIALHDLILIKKLSTLNKIKDYWNFYLSIFKTSLKCLLAFKNLTMTNKIDFLISPNNLYSHHQVVAKYAMKIGVIPYSLGSNGLFPDKKLQYLKLSKNITAGLSNNALKKWENIHFDLTNDEINFVMKYLETNFLGKHYLNFSKPKKKNESFFKKKILDYKKIVGVILSGAEEDYCLIKSDVSLEYLPKSKIFQNQIEWLKCLSEYIRKNKDILFIFRLHPRDLKNDDKKYTENYFNIINLLNSFDTKNIVIDDPQKNVSIYEYLDIVDLLLTYGSTTLIDFSLLGVPIVDSDLNKLQYPHNADFDYSDIDGYFEKVDYALTKSRNLEISEKYFRWFIWTNLKDTLNISNQISKTETQNIYNLFYKSLTRTFEKIGLFIFKKNELKKLKYIDNKKKEILINFFKNQNHSLIDIHTFENQVDKVRLKQNNINNINEAFIKFGKKYINTSSKFYDLLK